MAPTLPLQTLQGAVFWGQPRPRKCRWVDRAGDELHDTSIATVVEREIGVLSIGSHQLSTLAPVLRLVYLEIVGRHPVVGGLTNPKWCRTHSSSPTSHPTPCWNPYPSLNCSPEGKTTNVMLKPRSKLTFSTTRGCLCLSTNGGVDNASCTAAPTASTCLVPHACPRRQDNCLTYCWALWGSRSCTLCSWPHKLRLHYLLRNAN